VAESDHRHNRHFRVELGYNPRVRKRLEPSLAKWDASNQDAVQRQNEAAAGTWDEYNASRASDPRMLARLRWGRWVLLALVIAGVAGTPVAFFTSVHFNAPLATLSIACSILAAVLLYRSRHEFWPRGE
jgi:hypothetical protein